MATTKQTSDQTVNTAEGTKSADTASNPSAEGKLNTYYERLKVLGGSVEFAASDLISRVNRLTEDYPSEEAPTIGALNEGIEKARRALADAVSRYNSEQIAPANRLSNQLDAATALIREHYLTHEVREGRVESPWYRWNTMWSNMSRDQRLHEAINGLTLDELLEREIRLLDDDVKEILANGPWEWLNPENSALESLDALRKFNEAKAKEAAEKDAEINAMAEKVAAKVGAAVNSPSEDTRLTEMKKCLDRNQREYDRDYISYNSYCQNRQDLLRQYGYKEDGRGGFVKSINGQPMLVTFANSDGESVYVAIPEVTEEQFDLIARAHRIAARALGRQPFVGVVVS